MLITPPSIPDIDLPERIRRDVVAGVFPFGTRLRIHELAARYGVSPMPVREALRELRGSGLVVMERHHGARVRAVDSAYVENVFDVRSAIETMLARRAAERRTPAQLAQLQAIEARLEAHVAAGDAPAVLVANREFHDVVNAAADNPEAVHVAGEHWSILAALWGRFGYREARFAGVISDHRHLIAALTARDPDVAGAIMGAHVAKARQELLQQMREAASRERAA
ncbi:MAG TPA: GntR family transcriptional regulator [Casimicrobiaceae bacterium]|nr:GntR family transcriptional regulator [Casimicrobiaceae bacterium]